MVRSIPKRRTRVESSDLMPIEERQDREQRGNLARKCRLVFDRVYPQLIEHHYNWHIAIDADTEQYLIALTLLEITQQIKDAYGDSLSVKLTIFCLNETGTCGRI
jgi:hypothetical protein